MHSRRRRAAVFFNQVSELNQNQSSVRLRTHTSNIGHAKGDCAVQRCAVFTIVQNELVFLPLWLRHYWRHVAPADLYVLDHQSTDGSALEASRRCGARLVPVFRDHSFDHDWLCQTGRKRGRGPFPPGRRPGIVPATAGAFGRRA